MQDGRGKRLLELAQNANLNKKPKIIVHSVVTLNCQNFLEQDPFKQQIVKKSDLDSKEFHNLSHCVTTPKIFEILENQTTENKLIDLAFVDDSVQVLSPSPETTDGQNQIIEETQNSDVDPFECSDDKDKNFDPNDEDTSVTLMKILKPVSCKKRNRWNKADKTKWVRNVTKKCRNLGQSYVTKKGPKAAKVPKPVDCNKCRFSCSEKFSEEERFQLCYSYWQLEEFSRKKDFILQNVKSKTPQRQRLRKETAKARSNSKEFYFFLNDTPTRVCQNFFLKTLSISNGPLNKAFENKNESSGLFDGKDRRGRHAPSNKITQEEKKIITNHIESFPLTESHYCRKFSKRKYLDPTLSIAKLYSLYKIFCNENGYGPKSLTTYKRVFCNEYNYSFFKPRKDQCAVCMKYQSAKGEDKMALEIAYTEHKNREADANRSKKADKERACKEPNFVTVTFDLQSVLQIPSSDLSPMYYSRKLCAYNLTVYKGAPPNNAYCYTWTEVNGARGSLEIATCLYLSVLPIHVTEVSLFSDTCGGQNRNQNVLTMLYYFVHYENTSVTTVEQKFLESGHSMMECDSMHSSIEKQKRNVAVYTLNEWINIFKIARSKRGKKKNDPYHVQELKYKDFYDFKILLKSILKNKAVNIKEEKVKWLQVKCFKIEKANPGIVKYRYSHTGDYLSMNISGKGRRSKSVLLNKAYTALLPISVQKYNDLKKLCTSEVIPVEFHNWYLSLPTSKSCGNRNPEPSIESESEYEED